MQPEMPNGQLILALSKAQLAFPVIGKDKSATIQTRSGGSYTYTYADLATICEAIRKPLADNELAIWQKAMFNPTEGVVTVETVLGHSSGGGITAELQMPVGDPHDPRAVASAITYTRRYGLIALLGLAPGDEDDDAAGAIPVSSSDDRTPVRHQDDETQNRAVAFPTSGRAAAEGYRSIDRYRVENGWHHLSFFKADAQGGALVYKTKLLRLGVLAARAFIEGLPVKIEGKPSHNKDEWWLDKIELWKEPPDEGPQPPVGDQDNPF